MEVISATKLKATFVRILFLNDSVSQSIFPLALKLANITPVHKQDSKVRKIITGPPVPYQLICKLYERFFFKQIQSILNNFFPNINVYSEEVSVHNETSI